MKHPASCCKVRVTPTCVPAFADHGADQHGQGVRMLLIVRVRQHQVAAAQLQRPHGLPSGQEAHELHAPGGLVRQCVLRHLVQRHRLLAVPAAWRAGVLALTGRHVLVVQRDMPVQCLTCHMLGVLLQQQQALVTVLAATCNRTCDHSQYVIAACLSRLFSCSCTPSRAPATSCGCSATVG
jgi:hypothetical protein